MSDISLPSTSASTLCSAFKSGIGGVYRVPNVDTLEEAHAASVGGVEPPAGDVHGDFKSSRISCVVLLKYEKIFLTLVTSEGNKNPWEYLRTELSGKPLESVPPRRTLSQHAGDRISNTSRSATALLVPWDVAASILRFAYLPLLWSALSLPGHSLPK